MSQDQHETGEQALGLWGDYEIEARLGRGGMGEVFLARNRFFGTRVAVKRALVRDSASRERLFHELLVWTSLPAHPNLVTCRFFRTAGSDLLIFADFVEGGSLSEWIEHGKIPTLETALDVAIQFAWGLHVAHGLGIVHQDVKPANVLLTSEGLVKVTDFGLARAGVFVAAEDASPAGKTSAGVGAGGAVSHAGAMTPAYCSPEQARGRPLTRKTDIWSWGISVLEIFAGPCSWVSGVLAPGVLDAVVAGELRSETGLALPAQVEAVLRKCFMPEAERWASMAQVTEALVFAWAGLVGRAYSRRLPSPEKSPVDPGRSAPLWEAPQEWARANAPELVALSALQRPLPVDMSMRARAIADLAAFEALAEHPQLGAFTPAMASLHLSLLFNVARLFELLDDLSGANATYDTMLALLATASTASGDAGLQSVDAGLQSAVGLVTVLKSEVLRTMGDFVYALELSRWGGSFCRDPRYAGEAKYVEAKTLLALGKSADTARVAALAAVDLLRTAFGGVPQDLWALRLWIDALVLAGDVTLEETRRAGTSAGPVRRLPLAAKQHYRDAIDAVRRLDATAPPPFLLRSLAAAHQRYGRCLEMLQDRDGAATLYERALSLFRPYLATLGQDDLVASFAILAVSAARTTTSDTEQRELVDEALAMFERLVSEMGRADLVRQLAETHLAAAEAFEDAGQDALALGRFGRAIDLFERQLEVADRRDVLLPMVRARLQRMRLLERLGRVEASEDGSRLVALLGTLSAKHGAHWVAPLWGELRLRLAIGTVATRRLNRALPALTVLVFVGVAVVLALAALR